MILFKWLYYWQESTLHTQKKKIWVQDQGVVTNDGTTLLSMTGNSNAIFEFNGTDWVLM